MEPTDNPRQQDIIQEIERLVETGQQKEITAFFDSWAVPPNRIGDWLLQSMFQKTPSW